MMHDEEPRQQVFGAQTLQGDVGSKAACQGSSKEDRETVVFKKTAARRSANSEGVLPWHRKDATGRREPLISMNSPR